MRIIPIGRKKPADMNVRAIRAVVRKYMLDVKARHDGYDKDTKLEERRK